MAITPADIKRIQKMRRKNRSYIEWYGMKRALLSSVGLPGFFPLKAHLQHGAGMIYRNDVPDPLLLKAKYQNIFLCNNYQKEICQKYLPKKDIYVVGSIFPLYRQKQGIVQNENAQGTLFFTAHSTESIKTYENIEKNLELLEQLPDYLKPIKISIYYADLLKGLNEVYEKHGYETFTSGHRKDASFIDNFYGVLKTVKFAMGSTLGSQTYYAVEMGIPYTIIGDIPEHVNKGNEYLPMGTLKVKDRIKHGYAKHDKARLLFVRENFNDPIHITKEQQLFVQQSIGYYDKISPNELKNVVLKSTLYISK